MIKNTIDNMSSLYIHPENQEILWKTIHSVAFVQNIDETYKMEWFKSIIERFHLSNPNVINFDELREMNSKTIEYMCGSIKEIIKQFKSNPLESRGIGRSPPESIASRTQLENKTEVYTSVFSERNKDYEKMLEKPTASVDAQFKDSKDEPITNMDELIKKHIMERELMEKEIVPFGGEIQAPLPAR